MGAFLQLAPTATNAGYDASNRKAFLEAQAAAREAAALPDKLDVSYAQPTREMREELQAQGVVLPSADEERRGTWYTHGAQSAAVVHCTGSCACWGGWQFVGLCLGRVCMRDAVDSFVTRMGSERTHRGPGALKGRAATC